MMCLALLSVPWLISSRQVAGASQYHSDGEAKKLYPSDRERQTLRNACFLVRDQNKCFWSKDVFVFWQFLKMIFALILNMLTWFLSLSFTVCNIIWNIVANTIFLDNAIDLQYLFSHKASAYSYFFLFIYPVIFV